MASRHLGLVPLPIDAVLPQLLGTLAAQSSAVLVAPPGAGKTTRVPLALFDAPWLDGRRILVLEPRRIAARAAATHMARLLGEPLGDTIGLRARLQTVVGPRARVEVVTEGVLTRLILDDPSLSDYGAVLFDEFHERSLDADLGLAFAIDAQDGLRPDLRLVAMSATLDGARVARLLGDAPVIRSDGRAHAVETRYLGRATHERIEDQMAAAIRRAVAEEPGSALAFLPGQREIERVAERLVERPPQVPGVAFEIVPLHGGLEPAEQDRAIRPAAEGVAKIVLATSIAETSITIEGVRIVVDSGLARVPRYDSDVGVTRLETVKVSRAAADQRRGRAGRTEPGVCYRLWDEPQTMSLPAFPEPEILASDLAGLLLECGAWGVADPTRLRFLDPPPKTALDAARSELMALGALDANGRLTEDGRRLRRLPLPPRLAHMLLEAARTGEARAAAGIAAVLVERGLGGSSADVEQRIAGFRREPGRRADAVRRLADGWAREAERIAAEGGAARGAARSAAGLLALAFPERIARARGSGGAYLLANGRGAYLDPAEPLSRQRWLVVAEMQGSAARSRIRLAAAIDEDEVRRIARPRIRLLDEVFFDQTAAAVRARRTERLEAIVISSAPRQAAADQSSAESFAVGIAGLGIGRLPWSKAQLQLRERVAFLRASAEAATVLPDLSDAWLATHASDWLAPCLIGKTRLDEIAADDLGAALDVLLPWAARQMVDSKAPTHFVAPTGNRFAIDYAGEGAPAVHIRVQELFGLTAHPAIAGGKRPLTLHLLSPAGRPIQITRDLPGFWAGSWHAVKSEMRGRYPRHPWPDDPAGAVATSRAKPRG